MSFDRAEDGPFLGGGEVSSAEAPMSPTRSAPVSGRPSWIALPIGRASVGKARRFAAEALRGHHGGTGHVADIVLVVSELVTSARRAAAEVRRWRPGDLPLRVGVLAAGRYVHLFVTDPAPEPIERTVPPNDWALCIVDTYAAARWVTRTERNKTVHVLVPAPAVTLYPAEIAAIRHG